MNQEQLALKIMNYVVESNSQDTFQGMLDEYVEILNKFEIPKDQVPNTLEVFSVLENIQNIIGEN